MKWKDDKGDVFEVSYMSKRMWYLLLAVLLMLLLLTFVDVALRLYQFYWIDRWDIVSHLVNILERCNC